MSRKILIVIVLIALWQLSCEEGFELNLSHLEYHATQIVKVKSELLGEKDWGMVNLTWWFLLKPEGDSVIVERSLDSLEFTFLGSVAITDTMRYTDTDTVVVGDTTIWYRLSHVNNNAATEFETIEAEIPAYIEITEPATDSISIPTDTILVTWTGTGFGNYKIEIFKACPTQIESLINLTNPIFSETSPGGGMWIPVPDSLFPPGNIYTIRITSSKLVELVTDTSIGFRAFFRLP